MALSNLRNEPRREITEQVAGMVLITSFLLADYAIVRSAGADTAGETVLGMVLGFCALVFGGGVLFFLTLLAHSMGELVCGGLARLGLDPRPKQRYRR